MNFCNRLSRKKFIYQREYFKVSEQRILNIVDINRVRYLFNSNKVLYGPFKVTLKSDGKRVVCVYGLGDEEMCFKCCLVFLKICEKWSCKNALGVWIFLRSPSLSPRSCTLSGRLSVVSLSSFTRHWRVSFVCLSRSFTRLPNVLSPCICVWCDVICLSWFQKSRVNF